MNSLLSSLIVVLTVLVVAIQSCLIVGRTRTIQVFGGILTALLVIWFSVAWLKTDDYGPESNGSVASGTCFKCHQDHYASWHQSYHRSMTREATPENVKADFENATLTVQGVTSRMTREGDQYYMETADHSWADSMAASGKGPKDWGVPPLKKYTVDRIVGSHWFQEFMHKESNGRYVRLPLSYHIVEKRWIHTNGAFLAPDTDDFWNKSKGAWNDSCLFCHNTKPSKRPQFGRSVKSHEPVSYDSQVAELGIACEACHGPGGPHEAANQDPFRRLSLGGLGASDVTIVNPRRLPVALADSVCAHCHAGHVPRAESWDLKTMADPFNAGENLGQFYAVFWSEAEQRLLSRGARTDPRNRPRPDSEDGRFWGDGTPLTTAVEYQGMALSACYQEGHGEMKCLSCHSMHQGNPNFQLSPRMETNEACFQCHAEFRERLADHTHHAADSPGSLCYNCHMPYQVYSLLTTHRSHRIAIPKVKESLGTGKPHACNLCHLDKSLGWTQEQLGKWYKAPSEPLSEDDRLYSSAFLHLCQSDARSRAVVAGAFSWPPAQQATGTDWFGTLLVPLMDEDRYPAVRYLAHRGLRSVYGDKVASYNYLANAEERRAALRSIQDELPTPPISSKRLYPYLPLDSEGRLEKAVLERLLLKRNDPDVFINE
ncbi:MAG: cytochrome c3 family protein [Gemmataceae bacterium]